MAVYLLHFSQSYKHAGHYLGSADDVAARVQAHQVGTGARLTQVVVQAGITLEVVRVWPGGRQRERALKRQHNGRRLCPLCSGKGVSDGA